MSSSNLFDVIVEKDKLNDSFETILNNIGHYPTRKMLEYIFDDFEDSDGNFIEQFQTTGFDARIFELYIFAYLNESGFKVMRDFNRPDFIVEKNNKKVAVEVTTVNPTNNSEKSSDYSELSYKEILDKVENELPIKFGSPLFSKLKKEYWNLEHCKNIPFVIAIEAFHEERSLDFSSGPLIEYLYGIRQNWKKDKSGKLIITEELIEKHKKENKEIPSGFFNLPEAKNISAVIFSNSGTIAKFKRIGYLNGFHEGNLKIYRKGFCYDHDPNSVEPNYFNFDLDNPLINENWGEGLVICFNPNTKNKLPKGYFPSSAEYYKEKGALIGYLPEFHPFASNTYSLLFKSLRPKNIKKVSKDLIDDLILERDLLGIITEKEYYISRDKNKIGIIFLDNIDLDYGFIVFNKIKFEYSVCNQNINFKDIYECRIKLFEKLKI